MPWVVPWWLDPACRCRGLLRGLMGGRGRGARLGCWPCCRMPVSQWHSGRHRRQVAFQSQGYNTTKELCYVLRWFGMDIRLRTHSVMIATGVCVFIIILIVCRTLDTATAATHRGLPGGMLRMCVRVGVGVGGYCPRCWLCVGNADELGHPPVQPPTQASYQCGATCSLWNSHPMGLCGWW